MTKISKFVVLGLALSTLLAGCATKKEQSFEVQNLIAVAPHDRDICVVAQDGNPSTWDVMARVHLQDKGYRVKWVDNKKDAYGCRERVSVLVSTNNSFGMYQPTTITVEWRDSFTGERRRSTWGKDNLSQKASTNILTSKYTDDPQQIINRLIDNLFPDPIAL